MLRRSVIILLAVGLVVAVVASPAFGHVSLQPGDASQGGFSTQWFQVPNEREEPTVQVEITFPADHPIRHVSVQPVAGWEANVEMATLDEPIKTDEGEITEAVSKITWSGGQILAGQFERFPVSMGPLPEVDQLVFPAVQTYEGGEVVRWIDTPTDDGTEPENPAPVLTLEPGGDAHGGGTGDGDKEPSATEAALPKDVATTSDVDSAKTIGIIGIVLGALGVILGGVAIARKSSKS